MATWSRVSAVEDDQIGPLSTATKRWYNRHAIPVGYLEALHLRNNRYFSGGAVAHPLGMQPAQDGQQEQHETWLPVRWKGLRIVQGVTPMT